MNAINRALAATFLTAGLAAGVASPASAQIQTAPSNTECIELGKSKGVIEFPDARRAFQDDTQKGLGCVFGYSASGGFIPLAAYNLNDSRQSARYSQELTRAQSVQERAEINGERQAQNEMRRAEAEERRRRYENDPLRQLEENTRRIERGRRAIDRLDRILKF